ncbi:MAG: Crp/Fnr family transcriptional regulator [Clostridium sp.]
MRNENSIKAERLFKGYPILEIINKENNNAIIKHGTFKPLEADQYLSSLGIECSGTIFVLSGVVKIQKINLNGDETNLYNIESGDFCHEALSCLMKCEPLNIVARALTDAEVFIIDMDVTQNILLNNIDFTKAMYKDMFSKFNNLLSNKETIIHESLDRRLVQLIIDRGSNVIYAKHSELAFEIDSTRETVSRKLKALEKEGYLKLSRGKIQILKDLHGLL